MRGVKDSHEVKGNHDDEGVAGWRSAGCGWIFQRLFFLSFSVDPCCVSPCADAAGGASVLLVLLMLVGFNRSAVCRQGVGYRKWGEVLCPWNHLC